MSDPSALFRRVRQRKAELSQVPEFSRVPAPAPVGGTAPAAPPAAPETAARPSAPQAAPGPVPRPARGHALYSQLMRSHDRMGTRHLPNG